MAFKIKAADQKRIDAAFEELTAQRSTLEESVRVFNEAVAVARAKLQPDVDAYNEKVHAARGMLDDVHRALEDEFGDRSANWQNGDKGIAAKEWIDSINALAEELTEAALDVFPESLEFEDVVGDDPAEDYNELDKEAPGAE
jgi:CHASE1-domain containing sensor protein